MPIPSDGSPNEIAIGPNPRMRAIFQYLAQVGPGQATVLVTGESGTGKEIVANLLHAHSLRRDAPLVAVSCALFSDSLIEAELFGHERGAFTGAVAARTGRFERAHGGTLFLDDVDDVPLAMQVKLLRALQNRTIERLGGTRAIPIDVRIVAGTKRDLRRLVDEGKFREDLYYRLNVLAVNLPPLRERREDLPVLLDHFLRRFFGRRGMPVPVMTEATRQLLMAYAWPGNVRELENTCERIAESCICGEVRLGCLGASVLFSHLADEVATADFSGLEIASEAVAGTHADLASDARPLSLDERLRHVEANLISAALRDAHGNKTQAAARLGVKRSTLGDRIARCGLEG